MTDTTLVIGNKAYSSWSLRAWLVLMQTGTPFAEVVIPLRQGETQPAIRRHSPSGKVPLLKHQGHLVWESLAIVEYLAEAFPKAGLWPADTSARATARAISAEMHAGFAPLRHTLPMDLKGRRPAPPRTAEVEADIARIDALWRDARARFGGDGPFLFGRLSAADAMYAPVCTRFATYGIDLDPELQAYVDAVLALPALRRWYADAAAEPRLLELG
jgi:glutathione S-transferase